MTIQIADPQQFAQRARQMRAQVSTVLTRWGLLPRFRRWRLTQDPDTGMVVLFGVLNHRYLATHTSIPIGNYFDPCVLHELANELGVQVVSCNSDGLRYAFILDRGQLGKLLARVVYGDNTPSATALPVEVATVDDRLLVHRGVGAFLKVFDDIKLRDEAALQLSAEQTPDIVAIGQDEFHKRIAENTKPISRN